MKECIKYLFFLTCVMSSYEVLATPMFEISVEEGAISNRHISYLPSTFQMYKANTYDRNYNPGVLHPATVKELLDTLKNRPEIIISSPSNWLETFTDVKTGRTLKARVAPLDLLVKRASATYDYAGYKGCGLSRHYSQGSFGYIPEGIWQGESERPNSDTVHSHTFYPQLDAMIDLPDTYGYEMTCLEPKGAVDSTFATGYPAIDTLLTSIQTRFIEGDEMVAGRYKTTIRWSSCDFPNDCTFSFKGYESVVTQTYAFDLVIVIQPTVSISTDEQKLRLVDKNSVFLKTGLAPSKLEAQTTLRLFTDWGSDFELSLSCSAMKENNCAITNSSNDNMAISLSISSGVNHIVGDGSNKQALVPLSPMAIKANSVDGNFSLLDLFLETSTGESTRVYEKFAGSDYFGEVTINIDGTID